jgi:hypothetical protein
VIKKSIKLFRCEKNGSIKLLDVKKMVSSIISNRCVCEQKSMERAGEKKHGASTLRLPLNLSCPSTAASS